MNQQCKRLMIRQKKLIGKFMLTENLTKLSQKGLKNGKKKPKVGLGWYAGGTVFVIKKINGNKVYTEEEKQMLIMKLTKETREN